MGPDFIREQIVFALDIIRRRWLLLLIPVLLTGVVAVLLVKLSPKKYTATSLILLQAANRPAPGSVTMQRSGTFEQVRAAEAWLKSDHVLAGLLPKLTGYRVPDTPEDLAIETRILATSLAFDIVGGGNVLQISLDGPNKKGLGRNLEIILSRLMEGLTGPEQNIFSASQFVLMRRSEDVTVAETDLMKAIEQRGFQTPLQVRTELQQLWKLTRGNESSGSSSDQSGAPPRQDAAAANDTSQLADRLRRAISSDPDAVAELERLYAVYQDAVDRYESIQNQMGTGRGSNYVSIFDSPQDLLIIGRPQDPILGQSAARKMGIAAILMSGIVGCGLVFMVELFAGLLRTRKDYESTSGLPVVARMAKIPKRTLRKAARAHA